MIEKLTKKRNKNIDSNEIVNLKLLTKLLKQEKVAVLDNGKALGAREIKNMLKYANGYKIDVHSVHKFDSLAMDIINGLESTIYLYDEQGKEMSSFTIVDKFGDILESDITNFYKMLNMQISSLDLAKLRSISNFKANDTGSGANVDASHIIKINHKDQVWVLKVGGEERDQGFASLKELLDYAEKMALALAQEEIARL